MELKLRQTVPLAVLHAMDGKVKGRTRMMKLVFLVENRLVNTDLNLNETVDLEFYPYDYGPFSKVLLKDLEELDRGGVIDISQGRAFRNTRYDYEFTDGGKSSFINLIGNNSDAETIVETADEVVNEFGTIRIRELLDYVYKKFPEYQENSVYY